MSAWTSKPPEGLAAWRRLGDLAERRAGVPGQAGENRFEAYSAQLGPLLVDYSKQRVDAEVMAALVDLAMESGVVAAIDELFSGAPVNLSENRAALHTALRAPPGAEADPAALASAEHARAERGRFLDFAERLRGGQWRGCAGRPIRAVVHIGIGGSQLGPELACAALAPPAGGGPEIRFLANVDGAAATAALDGLAPTTTLFIVASKSFTTLETRVNAATARSWFLERTCAPDAMARHFVAVTGEPAAAAAELGLPPENCFAMWDWVGGRYSLWSAAGLPVAIALGRAGFEELLAGARLVDEHFRHAPLAANLPAILALLQVWNSNFHGAASHAVLAYDRRLRLLPEYLQQLEMESNGKSVRRDGEAVTTHTAPVIWGGEETNGQHAFHQWLHQGTRAFSADFIAVARPAHALAAHHRWLLANCLAQSQAMLLGRHSEPADGAAVAAHRRVAGNHPSTTLLLDELTPRALGALLALYEHKVFCLGVIWQINSFDQWGVELGKELAGPIHDQLAGTADGDQDASTTGLLTRIKHGAR